MRYFVMQSNEVTTNIIMAWNDVILAMNLFAWSVLLKISKCTLYKLGKIIWMVDILKIPNLKCNFQTPREREVRKINLFFTPIHSFSGNWFIIIITSSFFAYFLFLLCWWNYVVIGLYALDDNTTYPLHVIKFESNYFAWHSNLVGSYPILK